MLYLTLATGTVIYLPVQSKIRRNIRYPSLPDIRYRIRLSDLGKSVSGASPTAFLYF
jgi:hypothetical protein